MPDHLNYRSIAKANAIFGGVQVYTILIRIIRTKLVAVLLGAEGMGIMGLFQSTIDLVKRSTDFGIQSSAVRDVAIAHSSDDTVQISRTYSVISKFVWLTGLLGTFVTFIFAGSLSMMTFSTYDYTNSFRILSVVLLISQLTVSNQVMLQGMRKIKILAMNSIVGGTVGLLLVIPLYYLWRIKAIVPAILLTYIITYIVSLYSFKKQHVEKIYIPFKDVFRQGRQMIVLGFMLSLTSFMDSIQTYLVKIFISHSGDVSEVGLYHAGFSIILTYAGLVFSSISTDYYPRLAGVNEDQEKRNDVINDQMEIMLLTLLPMIVFFLLSAKFLIPLLFTEEFLSIKTMSCLIAVGMILRAISWCPGYLYIVKGDSKLYLTIYVATFFITTSFYLGLYYLWGLDGIGVAFIGTYIICSASAIVITDRYYHYIVRKETWLIIGVTILISSVALVLSCFQNVLSGSLLFFLFGYSCIYSYHGLNERLELGKLFRNKFYNDRNSIH